LIYDNEKGSLPKSRKNYLSSIAAFSVGEVLTDSSSLQPETRDFHAMVSPMIHPWPKGFYLVLLVLSLVREVLHSFDASARMLPSGRHV
jgi:hypothetical protein